MSDDAKKIELVYRCRKCGGSVRYHPGLSTLQCTHCGSQVVLAELFELVAEFDLQAALEASTDCGPQESETEVVSCRSCGAEFDCGSHVQSTVCPYCDVKLLLNSNLRRHYEPQRILPFRVEQQAAINAIRRWAAGLWLAPGDLIDRMYLDQRLHGVYLPLYSFTADAVAKYYACSSNNEKEILDTFALHLEDVLAVASNSLDDLKSVSTSRIRIHSTPTTVDSQSASRLIRRHQPLFGIRWDVSQAVTFNAGYLAGYHAEYNSVPISEAYEQASKVMEGVMRELAECHASAQTFWKMEVEEFKVRYEDASFSLLLVPIWTAAFQYRDKTFRVLVHGRDGTVLGERPYERWKVWLTVSICLGFLLSPCLFFVFVWILTVLFPK